MNEMHVIRNTQEDLYVASNFFYVYSDAQFPLRHPATSFLDNIIWRLSCLSPTTNRTAHLWMTTPFLCLTSKHYFCYTYGDAYSTQTFNNALIVATYIPLRNLAAKIPSQLNNYFLPSFLPSYETCSMKVRFILAAIKPS